MTFRQLNALQELTFSQAADRPKPRVQRRAASVVFPKKRKEMKISEFFPTSIKHKNGVFLEKEYIEHEKYAEEQEIQKLRAEVEELKNTIQTKTKEIEKRENAERKYLTMHKGMGSQIEQELKALDMKQEIRLMMEESEENEKQIQYFQKTLHPKALRKMEQENSENSAKNVYTQRQILKMKDEITKVQLETTSKSVSNEGIQKEIVNLRQQLDVEMKNYAKMKKMLESISSKKQSFEIDVDETRHIKMLKNVLETKTEKMDKAQKEYDELKDKQSNEIDKAQKELERIIDENNEKEKKRKEEEKERQKKEKEEEEKKKKEIASEKQRQEEEEKKKQEKHNEEKQKEVKTKSNNENHEKETIQPISQILSPSKNIERALAMPKLDDVEEKVDARIKIPNLPEKASKQQIEEFIKQTENIEAYDIDMDKRSAVAQYNTRQDAIIACALLDQQKLNDTPVSVELEIDNYKETKVIVTNLPQGFRKSQLKELVQNTRKPRLLEFSSKNENTKALLDYNSEEDAKNACELLNGKEVDGKKINARLQTKEENEEYEKEKARKETKNDEKEKPKTPLSDLITKKLDPLIDDKQSNTPTKQNEDLKKENDLTADKKEINNNKIDKQNDLINNKEPKRLESSTDDTEISINEESTHSNIQHEKHKEQENKENPLSLHNHIQGILISPQENQEKESSARSVKNESCVSLVLPSNEKEASNAKKEEIPKLGISDIVNNKKEETEDDSIPKVRFGLKSPHIVSCLQSDSFSDVGNDELSLKENTMDEHKSDSLIGGMSSFTESPRYRLPDSLSQEPLPPDSFLAEIPSGFADNSKN